MAGEMDPFFPDPNLPRVVIVGGGFGGLAAAKALAREPVQVLLIDRVCYQPPLGVLGRLLHRLYIRRTLERIFDYRRERLAELLAAPPPTPG